MNSNASWVWAQILEQVALVTTRATYDMWFVGTHALEYRDGILVIGVKNEYAVDWFENRLQTVLERALSGTPEEVLIKGFEFVVASSSSSASIDPQESTSPSQEYNNNPIFIRFHSLDPREYGGFLQTANYAYQFWQPFLGAGAFALYQTIRSFAWSARRTGNWPSLRQLAEITANGNKQTLTGRTIRGEWKDGYLQVLEQERLLYTRVTQGVGYSFTIVDRLPLLTPKQVARMPEYLQRGHEFYLQRHEAELGHAVQAEHPQAEWRALEEETLVPTPTNVAH